MVKERFYAIFDTENNDAYNAYIYTGNTLQDVLDKLTNNEEDYSLFTFFKLSEGYNVEISVTMKKRGK